MSTRDKLRHNLIRKIQQLSTDKLAEATDLLNKLENQFKSKEKTLQMAGAWKDLDIDFIDDLTKNLHTKRSQDREIK